MCQQFDLGTDWNYPVGLGAAIVQLLIAQGMRIRMQQSDVLLVEVESDWCPVERQGYWWISDNGGELQVERVNEDSNTGLPITTNCHSPLGWDAVSYAQTVVYRIMARMKGQPIDWLWRPLKVETPSHNTCKACGNAMPIGASECAVCGQLIYMPVKRRKR